MSPKILIGSFLLLCLLSRHTLGGIYLNGGLMSRVDSSGVNVGGNAEYDTYGIGPPGTANAGLRFNGLYQTTFLLTNGDNNFVVDLHAPEYSGLGLFFTPTSPILTTTSFGITPDLFTYVTGGGFVMGAPGLQVATLGAFSGNKPYSGATSFAIGSDSVSVSNWDGTNLTLSVNTIASVPEPSTFVSCGLMIALSMFIRSRRKGVSAVSAV